jgi:hypothetical protein
MTECLLVNLFHAKFIFKYKNERFLKNNKITHIINCFYNEEIMKLPNI